MINFLMRTSKCLGPVQYMNIWHDCSGKDGEASWFLDKVVLRNVFTDETFVYQFHISHILEKIINMKQLKVRDRTDNKEIHVDDKNRGMEITVLFCLYILVLCFCVITGWLLKRVTEK